MTRGDSDSDMTSENNDASEPSVSDRGEPETASGPDLSDDERSILAPVMDLNVGPDIPDADESGAEIESDPQQDVEIPDLSSHVDAFQNVLDALTQELDREEQPRPDAKPGAQNLETDSPADGNPS
jgi:hypothetical protein